MAANGWARPSPGMMRRQGSGSNARASAQGQRDERVQALISRIATALNVPRIAPQAAMGGGMLLRS
jgi:hypothetical protein